MTGACGCVLYTW